VRTPGILLHVCLGEVEKKCNARQASAGSSAKAKSQGCVVFHYVSMESDVPPQERSVYFVCAGCVEAGVEEPEAAPLAVLPEDG
jgi:hypothetical protein